MALFASIASRDFNALLSKLGEESRVIAEGHSLIPMMKLRLAMPEHLIDLAQIDDLNCINVSTETVKTGAMTTQHELITSEALFAAAPIIREMTNLADTPIFCEAAVALLVDPFKAELPDAPMSLPRLPNG